MNLPDDAIDRLLRNALALQRVHNAIATDASGILRALFDEVVAELAKLDPTAVGAERYQRARVDKLLARVEALTGDAFADWHKQVRGDLARLGRQQGEEAARILLAAVGPHEIAARIKNTSVTVNQIKAILDHNPFRGETLGGWAEVQEQATLKRVRQQIQIGMAENETIDQMVRRIRGTSAGILRVNGEAVRTQRGGFVHRFTGGVLETTTREAAAIVRTAVTEVAAVAHMEAYRQSADVTQTYTYTATLDSRTTLVCAELDGAVFRYDDPNRKMPPQHWQCRSAIVPNIDWDGLGVEPPDPGTRASADGQVPATLDYAAWLRRKSAAYQDDVLGPGRGRLFREGTSLSEMIRRDGSVIPLAELRGDR